MSEPRLLSNRYEIGDTLGYGGMSEVHRGRDIRLGRDVAVKVLRADLARDPTFQLRFRREAQNAAALNHPAIVAVYDTGETESENGPLPYIVMEFVDGRTLRDIVKAEGPLPARRAMEVMADASAALDFSHRHGIVHRDVKPANIMITGSGAVKVMDFGIARALADGQAAVTQTAAVIGTAQYLSPEQARGETVDARSDVYASGCVLFELVCGEPPFTGESPVAVAYQHVREDPRKPSDVNENVPPSLDAVVLKALSKNPANRYQSAAEMRADLVRVLSGQRPKAPMIMSEEERTSMLAPAAATELGGRHRPDDQDEYAEQIAYERRRRRRRNWTAALVTIASVAVVALVAWGAVLFTNMRNGPPTVPVPTFLHKSVDQALTSPEAKGWKMAQSVCPSSPQDVGQVVSQKPDPGTPAQQGSQVTLCRGTGPEQKPVPDLSNQTLLQAQSNLIGAGLKLGQTRERTVQDPSQDGKVLDWDHQGDNVAAGTAINVTVGKKQATLPVPSVVGQPFEAAQATLSSTNFRVKQVPQPSQQPAGTVLGQDPPGGATAPANSEVTLRVSDGSQLQMPSLVGKSRDEAEQALRSAGWSGQLQYGPDQETSDFSQVNKVMSSSPQAGSLISKSQPIMISVGKYELSPSTSTSPSGGGHSGGGIFPPFD